MAPTVKRDQHGPPPVNFEAVLLFPVALLVLLATTTWTGIIPSNLGRFAADLNALTILLLHHLVASLT